MENKIVRRSRISEIKCNLMKRRCTVVQLSKPYRKLILPEKSQRVFQNCILGSSLVYGVFVENCLLSQLLYLAHEAASQHSAAIA